MDSLVYGRVETTSRVWGDSLFPVAYWIFKLQRSNERWKKLELILTCLVQLGAGDSREEGRGDEDRRWLLMQNTTLFSYLSLPAWGGGGGAHALICLNLHGEEWGAHALPLVFWKQCGDKRGHEEAVQERKPTFSGTASSEQVPTGLFTSLHLVSVSLLPACEEPHLVGVK